ncbi:MAG TPA: hypothetical protein VH599_21025 [Ktedonobacterales bacterium]
MPRLLPRPLAPVGRSRVPSRRLDAGLLVRWPGGRTLALAQRWPPRWRRYKWLAAWKAALGVEYLRKGRCFSMLWRGKGSGG